MIAKATFLCSYAAFACMIVPLGTSHEGTGALSVMAPQYVSLVAKPVFQTMPICVTCSLYDVYGPIDVADTFNATCYGRYGTGTEYRTQDLFKRKYLCSNGQYWTCPRVDKPQLQCSVYNYQGCPEGTCAPTE